jgi:phosphoribosylformylglycinamidine cyclo-ligase
MPASFAQRRFPARLSDLLDQPVTGGRYRDEGLFVASPGEHPSMALATATRVLGDKFEVGRGTARSGQAGTDLVNAAVLDLLTAFAFAQVASCVLGGDDAVVEDLVGGVVCGCQAHGVELTAVEVLPAPGPYAVLQATGPVLAPASQPPLPGDVLVGLASAGLHSDGCGRALARLQRAGLAADDRLDDGSTVRASLLAQHRSYAGELRTAVLGGWLHRLVHVDRGGLLGSLERALDPACDAVLAPVDRPLPPLLAALRRTYRDESDFLTETNGGLGMVAICGPSRAGEVLGLLAAWNLPAWVIGGIERGTGKVRRG